MKKCKICKSEFEPKYSTAQPVCSYQCAIEYNKKEKVKEWEKQSKKVNKPKTTKKKTSKEYLQDEVNKLAKMIDTHFNYKCICCGNDYKGQIDACHLKSRGHNLNIAYNLHNIHKGRAYCNQYSNLHITGFENGLISRYSLDYFNMVDNELSLKYSYLGLTEFELKEALKITRECIRGFKLYSKGHKDGKESREFFNKLIGIYK